MLFVTDYLFKKNETTKEVYFKRKKKRISYVDAKKFIILSSISVNLLTYAFSII